MAPPTWRHLDPSLLELTVSKSQGRRRRTGPPPSAGHLTSPECQTNRSFCLSPDRSHILSPKNDLNTFLSVITDVLENVMEGTGHVLRETDTYTKMFYNSKWIFNPGLLTSVLGQRAAGTEAPRCWVKGRLASKTPTRTPHLGANAPLTLIPQPEKSTSSFEQREVHFILQMFSLDLKCKINLPRTSFLG